MTQSLRISQSIYSGLGILRDLGAENITKIVHKLSGPNLSLAQPSGINLVIKEIMGEELDSANAIVQLLISLYKVRRTFNKNAEELYKDITNTIQENKVWNEKEITRWQELEQEIKSLFSLPSIEIVVKTYDLSSDYTNLLQDVKILTDIRPVFDETASKIDRVIISFILRLNYFKNEECKNINIALDEKDVKELFRTCERALKKAETTKRIINKNERIKGIYVSGEEG